MSPRRYDALVMDVDGTLVDDRDQVHPRTRAAIARARAVGVQVMLATGRSAGGVRGVLRDLELTLPAIVYNGAGVYCPIEGRVIEHLELPEALVDAVLEHAHATELLPIVAMPDGHQLSRPSRSITETLVHASFRSLVIKANGELPRRGVMRVTLLSERHTESVVFRDEVQAILPAPAYITHFPLAALAAFRDSKLQVLDVQPERASKAEAMRILRERCGIPAERVVAIGDAGNDLPMLLAAGLGVAMGNATDEAKRAAKRTIGDNNGEALGALIEELFLVGE